MKEQFITKRFSAASLNMIDVMDDILVDYQGQGYRLTLRQLYYQLVARGIIENSIKSYNRIGNLVSDARLAGELDWEMIEDRTREVVTPPMWKSPAEIVQAAAEQFAIDRWEDQKIHVEVMVEKAALEGILIPVCRELGIRFTANRGYSSSSTMYEAAQRMQEKILKGHKAIVVVYLGDHDPSGIDMTRDVEERLRQLARIPDEYLRVLHVIRAALNMDQVEQWNPPENPAKTTDSRYASYMSQFGDSSWELDAIEPAELVKIVRDIVERLMDRKLYDAALAREETMRTELLKFVNTYGVR